jgi:hypothetical protein
MFRMFMKVPFGMGAESKTVEGGIELVEGGLGI